MRDSIAAVGLTCRAMCGALMIALASACSASGPDASAELLVALGIAEGLQEQAAELEATGDVAGAIRAVRQVLEVPFPAGSTDREDVRLDAYGRIAELELARGDHAAALAAIEAGRGEASRDSYFHARLLIALGRVQRASAAARREAGDAEGARVASRQAIGALEQSIAMNQRVLAAISERSRR